MALVYKIHEVFGGAIPRSGGKKSGDLISPRTIIGVFGNWQHFYMSETKFFDVGDKFVGKFAICEEA